MDSAQPAESDLRLLLVEGGPLPDSDLDRALADAAMYRLEQDGGDVMLFRGPRGIDPGGAKAAVREVDGG